MRLGTTACRHAASLACVGVWVGALTLAGYGQARSIADRVYSDAQAARGQQLYQKECVTCHGAALEGVIGPPLAGDGFLSVWGARTLGDLVDKIEQTMPPGQPGRVSRPNRLSRKFNELSDEAKFFVGPFEPARSAPRLMD